jgi:N-acyl-D-amino-acid deacylase
LRHRFSVTDVKKLSVDWLSLRQYAQVVVKKGLAINTVPFIGHISIAWKARLREQRRATREEIDKICELVREGMEEGARGLSMRISYPPNPEEVADFDEFVEPLRVVAEHGGILGNTHQGFRFS